MNEQFEREFKVVQHVVDNCSAHCIHDFFSNVKTSFLPPNMTSALQPVDSAIGRSFKAAFRRLLVTNVIEHLKELKKRNAPFKLSAAVTTYHGVLLMKKAWDLVPKSVVLNSWLKCRILAPHRVSKIKLIKEQSLNVIENTKKPATGRLLFDTDCILNESRREEAKRKGLQFLGSLTESTEITGQNEEFTEPCEFYQLTIENISSGLESIQHETFFSDLDAVELERFMSEEDIIPKCEQLSAEQPMRVSVDHAIDENSPTIYLLLFLNLRSLCERILVSRQSQSSSLQTLKFYVKLRFFT